MPGASFRLVPDRPMLRSRSADRAVPLFQKPSRSTPGRRGHQVANRLHGLLTQIHPSLERVLGPRLQHPAVLALLERFGSPAQIRNAGRRRLVKLLRPKAPRMAERLVDEIFTALDEQTVTVPDTEAAALVVPSLAGSLTVVLDQRKLLAGRIEELVEAHPLSKVLTSMPGISVRTGVRILIEVDDGSTFPTAGHLAAYAGLAPQPAVQGPQSEANNRPGEETSSSNEPSSSPRSPPWPTPPRGSTTTRKSPRASTTLRPCSASPDAGPTSSSPCSATEPSTNPGRQPQADPHHARHTMGSRTRRPSRSIRVPAAVTRTQALTSRPLNRCFNTHDSHSARRLPRPAPAPTTLAKEIGAPPCTRTTRLDLPSQPAAPDHRPVPPPIPPHDQPPQTQARSRAPRSGASIRSPICVSPAR